MNSDLNWFCIAVIEVAKISKKDVKYLGAFTFLSTIELRLRRIRCGNVNNQT